MGSAASKASKASKAVPKGAPRKYPTRAAGESLAEAATRRPERDERQRETKAEAAAEAAAEKAQVEPPAQAQVQAQNQTQTDTQKQPEPEIDGQDADFASRLRQMGIVKPNPTFSPSSTAGNDVGGRDADMLRQIQQQHLRYNIKRAPPARNTTLSVLDARRKIQDQATADQERSMTKAGRKQGQEFLKVGTIRDALALRARGVDAASIEKGLHLRAGVVKRLGPAGLFEALNVPEPTAAAPGKTKSK